MDFLYEPIDYKEPSGFEPLDLEDEDLDDESDDVYVYADEPYEEDQFEEEFELKGFDDLSPFGSFDDGFGWEDGFL